MKSGFQPQNIKDTVLFPSSARPGGDWMGAEGLPEHFERSSCTVPACIGRRTCYWAPAAGVSCVQLQWMGPSGGGDRGTCWERPRASLHCGSESKPHCPDDICDKHTAVCACFHHCNTMPYFNCETDSMLLHCEPLNRLTHMRSTGPSTSSMGASLFLRTTWQKLLPRLKKCAIFCVTRASLWEGQNHWTGPWSTQLQTSPHQVKMIHKAEV